MKKLFILVAASIAINVQAEVKCADYAEKKAAKYLEMTLSEFRKENSLIFTCQHKSNPKMESIQFGDGSSLVGVELEVIKGKCVAKDIYTGQDDQDFSEEDFQEACLPN